MNRLEGIISTLDYVLNTRRRKHITGGILMSMSLLFAGLALTVMSLNSEEDDNEEQYLE